MSISYVLDIYFLMCEIHGRSTENTVRHIPSFPEVFIGTSFSFKKIKSKTEKKLSKNLRKLLREANVEFYLLQYNLHLHTVSINFY